MILKNKLLVLAFITILASSLFVGLAVAKTNVTENPLSEILRILLNIQPQLQNVITKVDELNTNLEQIQPINTLIVSNQYNLPPVVPNSGVTPSVLIPLLPLEDDKTYDGHITLQVFVPGSGINMKEVILEATLGGMLTDVPIAATSSPSGVSNYFLFNTDFSCKALSLYIRGDYTYVYVDGVIHYQNCTNPTVLP
jgi:hypothetical protein